MDKDSLRKAYNSDQIIAEYYSVWMLLFMSDNTKNSEIWSVYLFKASCLTSSSEIVMPDILSFSSGMLSF